ncbi:MAG: DUF1761 domain-containing protein [Pseudomonadota bacterium]
MTQPGWIATLLGALGAFIFGALYYTVLAKPWMRATRTAPEDAKMKPSIFIIGAVFTVLISYGMGAFLATLGITNSVPSAVGVAVLAWAAFAFAPMAVNHRYQDYGWDLTIIDGVHWLGVFLIVALVPILLGGAPKFG